MAIVLKNLQFFLPILNFSKISFSIFFVTSFSSCSFLFLSLCDPWTFSISSVIKVSTLFSNKLDHCLVSCLFSFNFLLKLCSIHSSSAEALQFVDFQFPWSLTASTNLSVVLIISLSSATSSVTRFNCYFAFKLENFFIQSSFNFKQLSHK